jgi:periplasmic divalent cation tolerance protein
VKIVFNLNDLLYDAGQPQRMKNKNMDEPLLVSTTFERQEHAEELARVLLKKRLVACAQVHGPVESMYWWKDEIAESVEFVLTVKTFDTLYPEVEKTILDEHPYDVPEIIAEPLVRVGESYLAWMCKELRR